MHIYAGFYGGRRCEVAADTLLQAKQKVLQELRVPRSKTGLCSVVLAAKDNAPVLTPTHVDFLV